MATDGSSTLEHPGAKGISKVSVQTGTSHGGVPLPDGGVAEVKLDFEVLRELGVVARQYGLAGAVQHGASTLPDELFHRFPAVETAEIHLATGFQNALYEHPAFPAELHREIEAWCFANTADERKPGQTDQQFVYTTRKKAIGPFKRQLWELDDEGRDPRLTASQDRLPLHRARCQRFLRHGEEVRQRGGGPSPRPGRPQGDCRRRLIGRRPVAGRPRPGRVDDRRSRFATATVRPSGRGHPEGPGPRRPDLTLTALSGGITNRNFRVDAAGTDDRWVIRMAGNDTHLLGISREVEHAATVAAAAVGVGPEVTAFIRPEGYLVTRFIVGTRGLRRGGPSARRRSGGSPNSLRRVHDGPAIPGLFVPLRTVEAYRALALARGARSRPNTNPPPGSVAGSSTPSSRTPWSCGPATTIC